MVYVFVCLCHLVIPAMSYVRRSFSINTSGMDESDIDVSFPISYGQKLVY